MSDAPYEVKFLNVVSLLELTICKHRNRVGENNGFRQITNATALITFHYKPKHYTMMNYETRKVAGRFRASPLADTRVINYYDRNRDVP